MRVDRLQFECSMYGGGYTVSVHAWDGLKGRLVHLEAYDKLSLGEMRDVIGAVVDNFRPGTEFMVTDGMISIQSPLWD